MMTGRILGISAFYHDSAAALLVDGKIVAAAQEERFSRKKHDSGFPLAATRYCLAAAGLPDASALDAVVFYDKPVLKFMRLFETLLQTAPRSFRQYIAALPAWLSDKLWIEDKIQKALGYEKDVLFSAHHLSHAAAAFFPSPFKEAAFLTVDGVGEWATTTWGIGSGSALAIREELKFPHSLGLFYSAFTYFCGFRVNSGEYKLMGLAPYGTPRYAKLLRDRVIDIRADGSFRLDMRFFNYAHGLAMTGRRLERLLGFPRRRPEGPFSALYMDLAASVQEVAEDALLAMAGHVRRQTGMPHLCLAGGVALNCVANARLRDSGLFKDIWIQPASGDAGNALGAALAAWHLHFHKSRQVRRPDSQTGSLLGPAYNDAAIRSAIAALGLRAHVLPAAAVPNKAAALLADGKVLGWFQGRMEYGPRALGCRSILGDPRDTDMQTRMNLKIKFRESFRPFAPAVLEEKAAEWFETSVPSPYMLLTARVRNPLNRKKNAALAGFDKLAVKRSRLPAVTHVDYSARLQTVSKKINPLFHALISAFAGLTGIPVVINTSFNVRGEPIVCTPADALRCFLGTGMDALLLGRFLLLKQEQDPEKIAAHSDLKEGYVLD